MVFQVMRREIVDGQRGSMIARDVYLLMGGIDLSSIYVACKDLRRSGFLRYVQGSKRSMEIAPDAPEALFDGRGQSLTSLANLKHFGKRNARASMSTSRAVKGRSFVRDWK